MSDDALFLKTGAAVEVKLHPVVLFTALDHYMRRQANQKRVIGTLLGYENDGVVEITNCFSVPHKEMDDGEVAVGKEFNKQMLTLHQKVNPKEQIVGWYATTVNGSLVTKQSCLIHDFYGTECRQPIHLVIDTALTNNSLGVKGYLSSPLRIGKKVIAAQFQQVPVNLTSIEAEKVAIETMLNDSDTVETVSPVKIDQMDQLQVSIENLLQMLQTTSDYVDDVVAGRRPKSREVGRAIASSLSSVPHVKPDHFQTIFDDCVQDLLVVSYLSNITRTQLAAAERISCAANY
eukprot:GSMAST32.ASY1.ANO1.1891.1 assembled CDS